MCSCVCFTYSSTHFIQQVNPVGRQHLGSPLIIEPDGEKHIKENVTGWSKLTVLCSDINLSPSELVAAHRHPHLSAGGTSLSSESSSLSRGSENKEISRRQRIIVKF